MKWYFASNSESKTYVPTIKAMVISALRNTTLEPYFIYDGQEDELTNWLKERGVVVIFHRSNLYPVLEKHYDKPALKIASGAFLRCDIPIIEKNDEFVLYTDCDVLFLKDVRAEQLPQPKYFSCSSQFKKKDFVDFNTGVMLMNVRELSKTYTAFKKFIENNLPKLYVFDQSAYQLFYCGKNTPLDTKFNHKPYWGIDDEAVIVHYHGPKPVHFSTEDMIKKFNPNYYKIFIKDIGSYDYYLKLIQGYNSEIEYDTNALELLKIGKYPLVKTVNRPLEIRLKTFIRKKKALVKDIIERRFCR